MIKILFVCAANINRSPMAEAIFCKLLKTKELSDKFKVDSAGISNFHAGQRPFPSTRRFLDKMQIPYGWIRSRQITKKDLGTFDYIIAMDKKNVSKLHGLLASVGQTRDIHLLLDYLPEVKEKNLPDPSLTGNHMQTYNLLSKGCEKLLQHILESDTHNEKS